MLLLGGNKPQPFVLVLEANIWELFRKPGCISALQRAVINGIDSIMR